MSYSVLSYMGVWKKGVWEFHSWGLMVYIVILSYIFYVFPKGGL